LQIKLRVQRPIRNLLTAADGSRAASGGRSKKLRTQRKGVKTKMGGEMKENDEGNNNRQNKKEIK
jgi:hypothetical protein